MSTFFVDNADHFFSVSKPTSMYTLLLYPSIHLNASSTEWNTLFVELHSDTFLSAKFDNNLSTFFVDKPDQKFILLQNLLGCIHSYSSPHFINKIFWLDWKTLFVLHSHTFLSAKLDNDMSTFFVDNPDQKVSPFQSLLGCLTPSLALISFDQVLDQIEIHFSWNCIATIFWAQSLTTTWVLFS